MADDPRCHDGSSWRVRFSPGNHRPIRVDAPRHRFRPRVVASWSDDQGRSFAPPIELSTGVLDANHPMLFAGKPNGVWAAFEGRDARTQAGWSPFRTYVIRIDRPRTRAVAVTKSSADQEYPFAVMRDAQSLFIGVSSGGHAVLLRARIEQ